MALCLAIKSILFGNDDDDVWQLKRTRGQKGRGQHMTRVTRCDCDENTFHLLLLVTMLNASTDIQIKIPSNCLHDDIY